MTYEQVITAGMGLLLAVNGWQLLEIVRLKVEVAILMVKVENLLKGKL